MASTRFRQGFYTPKHPEKYMGDPSRIVYRSSWELNLHKFFDNNTRVTRWGSEIIKIPYIKPTDGRVHHYYPDYFVEFINTEGEIVRELIELKPLAQTRQPRSTRGKQNLYENLTFVINVAKWKQAELWCKKHGVTWRIITERDVFR